ADCTLTSSVGFVRQALLGLRYFIEKFGRPATVGYSPDAFGLCGGLPQLLSGCGLTSYIFCRPDPTELELPAPLFRWFSSDDSSVLAYRVPFHYNMYQTTVPKKVGDLLNALDSPSELAAEGRPLGEFGSEWALFYGVGNHGGGPTKEHIREIIAINEDPEQPDVWFGRLDKFFEKVEEGEGREVPEWRDDLQMNSPGCYSVHSTIKRLNRRAESELIRAEVVEVMSRKGTHAKAQSRSHKGAKPQRRKEEGLDSSTLNSQLSTLQLAWQNICFNHFHDILCGVAIPEALEAAVQLYGESLSIADRITRYGLRQIAGAIDTRGEGQLLLVVNPHSFDLQSYLTFELWHDIDKELWSQPVDLRLLDDRGIEVPVGSAFTSGKIGKDRIGGTFRADVPAMGWRCWRVIYGEKSLYADRSGLIEANDTILENEKLRVEFSSESGEILQLLHKESGLNLIDGGGAIISLIEDYTDTWGHGVTKFNKVIGRFDRAEVRLTANTPTHGTIRVVSRWGSSRVQQDFTLCADSDLLSVKCRIFQTEPRTMLKLEFPTSLENPRTVVEGAYTSIEKECDGTERPGGAWKAIVGEVAGHVNGQSVGLGIADTLTHGYSAEGGTLSLTLLRSPSYATHDPHVIDPNEDVRYIDMGESEFSYTIRPFAQQDFRTLLTTDATLLNAPPLLSLESGHDGGSNPLPATFRGVEISAPNIRATVLKRGEDGSSSIIRLFEVEGRETEAKINLPLLNVEWNVVMRGGEVKTFRIANGRVEETDLIES
ncbi:MAG: glycoside hydrolase family 38 C-terminal domain-containing protein, partial [Candidatus Kapaibacterium sp.]